MKSRVRSTLNSDNGSNGLTGRTVPTVVIRSAVYSPDGQRIVTTNWSPDVDGTCLVWDAETGKELAISMDLILGDEITLMSLSLIHI